MYQYKLIILQGKLIVIGSGDGAIKFYDYNFIILRWFEVGDFC